MIMFLCVFDWTIAPCVVYLQSGLIRRPVFFFGPSVHEQPNSAQLVHELTEIALSHGGSVTEEELKASYLVVWDDEVDGSLDREVCHLTASFSSVKSF